MVDLISEKLDLAVDDLAAELAVIADPVLEGDPSRPPPEGDDFLGGATGVEVTLGGEGLLLPKPVLDKDGGETDLLRGDDDLSAEKDVDSALKKRLSAYALAFIVTLFRIKTIKLKY